MSKSNVSVNTATGERLEEWTVEEIADQLTQGYWDGTQRAWNTDADNIITYYASSISAEYQQYAAEAFEIWSDIADIEFVSSTGLADITFQNTAAGAYASSSLSSSGGNL